jgi:hypothetical protein
VALSMQPVRVYKYLCLLLQVEMLGLAGFLYPSSGLLPWQEPGRQISRTEGSYLVSSPRVSSRFVESGRDSNLALTS